MCWLASSEWREASSPCDSVAVCLLLTTEVFTLRAVSSGWRGLQGQWDQVSKGFFLVFLAFFSPYFSQIISQWAPVRGVLMLRAPGSLSSCRTSSWDHKLKSEFCLCEGPAPAFLTPSCWEPFSAVGYLCWSVSFNFKHCLSCLRGEVAMGHTALERGHVGKPPKTLLEAYSTLTKGRTLCVYFFPPTSNCEISVLYLWSQQTTLGWKLRLYYQRHQLAVTIRSNIRCQKKKRG